MCYGNEIQQQRNMDSGNTIKLTNLIQGGRRENPQRNLLSQRMRTCADCRNGMGIYSTLCCDKMDKLPPPL